MNYYDNSQFGVCSYSYIHSCTAMEFLQRLGDMGFVEFELMVYPGHLWPAHATPSQIRALRSFIEKNNFTLTSLNMPNLDINLASMNEAMRRYCVEHFESVISLAGELGATGVVLGPGKVNQLFPEKKKVLEANFFNSLDKLIPLSEKAGVSLFVENMPPSFFSRAKDIMACVECYGNDDIGILYDLTNGFFVGDDLLQGLKTLQSRLRLIHISDTPLETYRHSSVGEGEMPWSKIPAMLKEIGYDKRVIMEIIDPNPDECVPQSVKYLKEAGW